MKVDFDPEKDRINREKHGLPLALGARVVANAVYVGQDERRDYGERRLVAFGYVDDVLYVSVYTLRDDAQRIISVRRASRREAQRYGERRAT